MAVRFLSEPWAEQALQLVETDPRVKSALRGVDVSLLIIVLEAPKDAYGFLYTAFDGGSLSDYRVGHDYHAVTRGISPTFVVSAHYRVLAQIQRGELDQRAALVSGKLHLTGPMLKALRHRGALEAIVAVLTSIPCDA